MTQQREFCTSFKRGELQYRVLKLNPNDKFLIYSPTNAPFNEDNWLLDLNIAHYVFSADRASLILQSLGLDVSYKAIIAQFDKFFNAPKRLEALKEHPKPTKPSNL